MSGIAKVNPFVKKAKKHGKKAGQKSLVKPSQKKSVKNGRHQEKETAKVRVAKTVAAIPVGLDGPVLDEGDELDDFLQEPEFDYSCDQDDDDNVVTEEDFADGDLNQHG